MMLGSSIQRSLHADAGMHKRYFRKASPGLVLEIIAQHNTGQREQRIEACTNWLAESLCLCRTLTCSPIGTRCRLTCAVTELVLPKDTSCRLSAHVAGSRNEILLCRLCMRVSPGTSWDTDLVKAAVRRNLHCEPPVYYCHCHENHKHHWYH